MSAETAIVVVAVVAAMLGLVFFVSRAEKSATPYNEPKIPDEKPLVPIADAPRILGFSQDGEVAHGAIGDAEITLTFGQPVRFEVRVPGIPADLVLAEEPNAVLRALDGGDDVTLGDAPFDDAIRIEGPMLVLLAALDVETRRTALREIVKHGFVVSDGKLRWTMGVFTTGDELASTVRAGAALASMLAVDQQRIAARLADNLLGEPVPEIRLRILQTLASRFPNRDETARAARQCAQDSDVSVRIAAANLTRGAEAVAALAAVAKDPAASDESRAAALSGIVESLSGPDLEGVLSVLFDSGSSTLAIAALRASLRRGVTPPMERLLALADAVHPDARAAAAVALDARDPQAEAKLLSMLENNEEPVIMAAITSLGRGGGLASVEKLLPFAQARFGRGEVKKQAAAAIAKIRERNPGGSSGQLTMTDDVSANAGQVSISDDRGAVSIANQKKQPT